MTKKTTQAVTPSPLLDAAGNPGLVSAGELIESAWGNAVATRVVAKYPNRAAIFAVSPTAGQLAVALDQNVVWIGTGSAWRPTSLGSTAHFLVAGAAPGQSITTNVVTIATWPTKVDDAFVAVGADGIFRVPAGWGGRWQFDWSVEFTAGGTVGSRTAFLGTSISRRYGHLDLLPLSSGTHLTGSASVVLPEGANASVTLFHSDTTTPLPCNTTGDSHFQGYYVGPD